MDSSMNFTELGRDSDIDAIYDILPRSKTVCQIGEAAAIHIQVQMTTWLSTVHFVHYVGSIIARLQFEKPIMMSLRHTILAATKFTLQLRSRDESGPII